MFTIQNLVQTFQRQTGFSRLFSLFREKYRSYEQVGQSVKVVLLSPTQDERKTLGGFFGENYTKAKTIPVTAAKLERAIQMTVYKEAFEGYNINDLVQMYYYGELTSKKHDKDRLEQKKEMFFNSLLLETHDGRLFHRFLNFVRDNKSAARIHAMYKNNPQLLNRLLRFIADLFARMPLTDDVYLPILSRELTGDPHALDSNTDLGKILLFALQVVDHMNQGKEILLKPSAEQMTEILFHHRIVRDDLLNFSTVYNGVAQNKHGGRNALFEGARAERAIFHLPLREIQKLATFETANGRDLFLIENSAVSSYLVNQLSITNHEPTIIVGCGQLKIATLKLLDLFFQSGDRRVWYSGDFDPEGLLIAQKLLTRYGNRLSLWRYSTSDYLNSILTDKAVMLDSSRLKKLTGVTAPELAVLKESMLLHTKAGYQEAILQDLQFDLMN